RRKRLSGPPLPGVQQKAASLRRQTRSPDAKRATATGRQKRSDTQSALVVEQRRSLLPRDAASSRRRRRQRPRRDAARVEKRSGRWSGTSGAQRRGALRSEK